MRPCVALSNGCRRLCAVLVFLAVVFTSSFVFLYILGCCLAFGLNKSHLYCSQASQTVTYRKTVDPQGHPKTSSDPGRPWTPYNTPYPRSGPGWQPVASAPRRHQRSRQPRIPRKVAMGRNCKNATRHSFALAHAILGGPGVHLSLNYWGLLVVWALLGNYTRSKSSLLASDVSKKYM
ncbi:hypothetical protein K491DRAFT_130129 [Lophiostoma macrostomum CBS 122681]|uniref:Uncharacterized protein n=1 Tax=Lophiostoma macrostomum CBS 122681 TaxID=1314788 RepID=A0A6A6SU52_9PLEO|nr:hypothetical protein K491DRAFT_130129 [Lophiostoma macrostomum CBS 122681]